MITSLSTGILSALEEASTVEVLLVNKRQESAEVILTENLVGYLSLIISINKLQLLLFLTIRQGLLLKIFNLIKPSRLLR